MLVTTTDSIEGARIVKYIGIVSGEAIMGSHFIRDFFANITDVIGGRSRAYEKSLEEGKDAAMKEMVEQAQRQGANAIIGIDLDYAAIPLGENRGSILMVAASGTAVVVQ